MLCVIKLINSLKQIYLWGLETGGLKQRKSWLSTVNAEKSRKKKLPWGPDGHLATHGLGKSYGFQSLFSQFPAGKDLTAEECGGWHHFKEQRGPGWSLQTGHRAVTE